MADITIVFPCLNEAQRLESTLDAYLDYFGERINIIVVDNGSTDGTDELIHRKYQDKKNVDYIYFDHPLGKGGAVYAGFDQATSEYVGFADPDGAIKPAEFDKLIGKMHDNDLVIASRWVKGAKISIAQPLTRVLFSRAFNLLVNLLFRLRIKDTQCGAKIISRSFYQKVRDQMTIKRWAFDVELIWRVVNSGGKVLEAPIEWENREGSKSASYKSLFTAITDVFVIKFRTI